MSFKLDDKEARQVEEASREMLRLQSQSTDGANGGYKPDDELPPEQLADQNRK